MSSLLAIYLDVYHEIISDYKILNKSSSSQFPNHPLVLEQEEKKNYLN